MFFNVIAHVGRIVRFCLSHVTGAALAPDAVLDEVPGFGHSHVRVNVHDRRPAAANDDFAAFAVGNGACRGLPRTPSETK